MVTSPVLGSVANFQPSYVPFGPVNLVPAGTSPLGRCTIVPPAFTFWFSKSTSVLSAWDSFGFAGVVVLVGCSLVGCSLVDGAVVVRST